MAAQLSHLNQCKNIGQHSFVKLFKISVVLLSMSLSLIAATPPEYPIAQRGNTVDEYFGVKVADPYRWLEDEHSEQTIQWVKQQMEVTNKFLDIIPARDEIAKRLRNLWDYERFGLPYKKGKHFFFTRNSGLQNQSVLYVAESLTARPRVLLDPNTLSTDGTVSLTITRPNELGTKLLYGTSHGGSDWQEFHIKDVATGRDEVDHLQWIKFSGASWAKDGSGFYYSRYPEPKAEDKMTAANKHHKLYFHKLGTPQADDKLIYERPDQPDWGLHGSVTEDGAYLIIELLEGTDPKNRLYYLDLHDSQAQAVKLLDDFDASYSFIHNKGSLFYLQTNLASPRECIICIDVKLPKREHWKKILPQSEHLLQSASIFGDKLLVEYLEHAHSVVKCYDLEGKFLYTVALPGLGSTVGFSGKSTDEETFYSYSSFNTPAQIYRYDISSGKSTLWKQAETEFQGDQLEIQQVFVKSKDGTQVPLFIVHKKGLKLDGTNRCLLYGYGGFNISLTPSFSMARAVWLERGGIFAMANLRGGGEYGEAWHQAGTKINKQNVFNDFIAAAEWLIQQRYTRPTSLAIQGGSNGGLLVGACMTQRPELFGAAVPEVGVMDMLRFQSFTIGSAWKSDYGSSENEAEFKALYAYSPLHQLKQDCRYPATLVITADHDDRVVPAHSFKFTAELQHCQAKDGPPVLIHIETSAGHGAGTALNKVIAKTANTWAFLEHVLE
jgi:prolyl oligopeptidase